MTWWRGRWWRERLPCAPCSCTGLLMQARASNARAMRRVPEPDTTRAHTRHRHGQLCVFVTSVRCREM
eukprot:scaffold13986_cov107-Isochrysis_galbana.AAC.1